MNFSLSNLKILIGELVMKWIERFFIVIVLLPITLFTLFIGYEIFGMCINHLATQIQTNTLQQHLESEIPDVEIVSVYSETGNTSGTSNHVDCLSSIIFSTQIQESEIEARMSKYYTFNDWDCYINQTDDGNYMFYVNTSAPFPDNIEGH